MSSFDSVVKCDECGRCDRSYGLLKIKHELDKLDHVPSEDETTEREWPPEPESGKDEWAVDPDDETQSTFTEGFA